MENKLREINFKIWALRQSNLTLSDKIDICLARDRNSEHAKMLREHIAENERQIAALFEQRKNLI